DHRRRARRPEVLVGEAVLDRPIEERDTGTDPELLAALGHLTGEQREVVSLRFVADLSLEDVAAITGRTANAVKAMQHRALAQPARIPAGRPGAVGGDG